MDHLNDQHPETTTTVGSRPMPFILQEHVVETINPLTAHTGDDHDQANREIEAEGNEDWRSNTNISYAYR